MITADNRKIDELSFDEILDEERWEGEGGEMKPLNSNYIISMHWPSIEEEDTE